MSGREPAPAALQALRLEPAAPAGRQRESDDRPQQLHAARRGWPLTGLFTAVFVAPVALTCVYFFAFAADQYASDAQFLVRGANMSQVALQVPGLSFARSSDETQIVASYMRSHDLLDALQRQIDLKEMYRRPEADFVSRYPGILGDSSENFLRHFLDWTSVHVDEGSGITAIRAYGYRADDAHAIAEAMMRNAETLINKINARAYDDRVQYAQMIVDKARDDVARVETKLTEFRNETKSVDLGKETGATFELVARMSVELAQLEATLRQQTVVTPNNPGLAPTRERIASYKAEIEKMRRQIAGSSDSMTTNLARFERLILERSLAARSLEAAIGEFDKARQEAQLQHYYLVRVMEPNRADASRHPRRFLWIAAAALAFLLLHRTLRALLAAVREHRL